MVDEWKLEPLEELCLLINRGIAPTYTEQGGILVINQKCIRDQRVSLARLIHVRLGWVAERGERTPLGAEGGLWTPRPLAPRHSKGPPRGAISPEKRGRGIASHRGHLTDHVPGSGTPPAEFEGLGLYF